MYSAKYMIVEAFMKLQSVEIFHYRSIENIKLVMPNNKPLVLFGPNNAGKSNILSAINRIIGEKYPTYIEMIDSDYFLRDKMNNPKCVIEADFDEPLYYDRNNKGQDSIKVIYGYNNGNNTENLLFNRNNERIYPTNEQRANCQAYLIDAERNIQSSFNYSSSYSLLSKFSKKIHEALKADKKDELTKIFNKIKDSFEQTEEYNKFFDNLKNNIMNSVKGFVHSLDVDFSAYDPNNYVKSMRIYAKENNEVRGFEEFGTGEQQVLLMAFIKAYMETFNAESFVLIIEEPEAHLHPLAQKWLKEYIADMCNSGIQVILSTHSIDLIDFNYLDGLVRVYKEEGITKIIQLNKSELVNLCIENGQKDSKITEDNVIEYFSTKMTNE